MKLLTATIVAAAVLVSGSAFAAAAPPKPKVETHDFLGTEIRGDFSSPGATPLLSYRSAKFANLIKTRTDFQPELEKSVDGL
ncbi:MAG: hypothetical protein QM765_04650 [Myxococcales bacterium]